MLIGHQKIWQLLNASYEADKISHGYLFFGESGLGKKKLAKEFVKMLNCQDFKKDGPCQLCRSCKNIEKEFFPDLTIIEPLNKEIKIDQIRDLKYTLTLKPYEGKYKSAIINEAQSLNQEAFSCLLKTLEEPLGKAVLILVSSAKESLPKTILSRVEHIKFHKVNLAEIENYLQLQGANKEKAKELSLFSEGKPGAAIDYFNNQEKLEEESEKIGDLIAVKNFSLAGRFEYAKELVEGESVLETLQTWLKFLRSVLLFKLGVKDGQLYKNFYKDTEDISVEKVKKILNTCEEIHFLLKSTNVNPKLALETLMIEL